MKKITLLALIACCSWSTSQAQKQVETLISAGQDAAEVMNAYLAPVFKGFGAAMNNGWYNTANVHKSGRFDLTISLNAPLIPSTDKTYKVTDLHLKTLTHDPSSPSVGQTVAGKNTSGPVFNLYIKDPNNSSNNLDTIKFTSPGGASLPLMFAPTAQLGVGIIKGTELIARYMPTINFGDYGSVGLWGLGVKHDIKQWIPIADKLPFDLSVLAGYTQFKSSVNINAQPLSDFPGNTSDYTNQKLNLSVSSTTVNAIISKKLLFLTLYAGAGYMGSSTHLTLSGKYPIPDVDKNKLPSDPRYSKPVDGGQLVDKTFAGANGLNATGGFRLKFFVVTIGAGYTVSKYSTPSLGLGLCVDFL